MHADNINVKDIKLLAAEHVALEYYVHSISGGFILFVKSTTGNKKLISQRGNQRVFKTLDALFSFLCELRVKKFEVQVINEKY